jgi:hypothetical protein
VFRLRRCVGFAMGATTKDAKGVSPSRKRQCSCDGRTLKEYHVTKPEEENSKEQG